MTAPETSPDTTRTPVPAAALWDFDGTLADTEPVWMRAEYALVESLGGQWNDDLAHQMVGNSLIDSGQIVVDHLGRDDISAEWVVENLVRTVDDVLRSGDIPWRPGALDLLESFRAAGVPCALVSASYRSTLEAVTQRLPGAFDLVVAGDEVDHGKPHPEPYLRACRTLGVDPRDCVVLEDSVPGTTSGNASGAVVLAIRNHVPLEPAPRRVLLDTLVGITAADVAGLAAGAAG
ncbi:HAD family phosphatase [Mariniluteicoccus endophyticus]